MDRTQRSEFLALAEALKSEKQKIRALTRALEHQGKRIDFLQEQRSAMIRKLTKMETAQKRKPRGLIARLRGWFTRD